MALTQIEKEWLDERFGRLEDKIEQILQQTTKTNGRVSSLEERERSHLVNCPVAPKVEKMEGDLMEYKMIKKYPKFFIAGFVLFGISIILIGLAQIGIL